MFFLNYIVIPLVLIIMIFLIRSYARRKNNIPGLLFAEALRNENSGHYEEAVITYKNALANITPSAFRNDVELKNRIIEKLKVLHTMIGYQKNITHGR